MLREDAMPISTGLSLALHVAIALVAWFGLPLLGKPPVMADRPILVDIVTIAAKTNLPPPAPEPRPEPPKVAEPPKPEPPKPEPPKAAEVKPEPPRPLPPPPPEPRRAQPPPPPPPPPPPSPPAPPPPRPAPPAPPKLAEPLPAPKAPEPKPEPPKQAMVQPPPPKPKPPEKKPEPPKPSVFDSLLKDLTSRKPAATDEAAKPQPPRPQPQAQPQPPAPRQTASARTPQAFTDQPLTLSELDAIRAQISQCWNVPAGARDAKSLVVDIFVEMNPDGTIRTARIVDQARLYSDAFYRAAAESAMRAVLNPQCSPLRLPREKYDTWKTFTLSFNPKDMLS